MKTVSKIMLGIAGVICLAILASVAITFCTEWLIALIKIGYRLLIVACIALKVDPSIVYQLLAIIQVVNPISTAILFLLTGYNETADYATVTMMVFLIIQCAIFFINGCLWTAGLILPILVFFFNCLFSFLGMALKKAKGIHIFDIMLGALSYLYGNQLVGTFMLVGGIMGVISDSKQERRDNEEKERLERRRDLDRSDVGKLTLVED